MFLLPRKRRALSGGSSASSSASSSSISTPSHSSSTQASPGLHGAPAPHLQHHHVVQQGPTATCQVEPLPMRQFKTPPPTSAPVPSAAAPARSWPCRQCGVQLSSASNRIRHERRQHADKLAATTAVQRPAPGLDASSTSSTGSKRSAAAAALSTKEKEDEEVFGQVLGLMCEPMVAETAVAAIDARSPTTQLPSSEAAMEAAEDATAVIFGPKQPPPERIVIDSTVPTNSEIESMSQPSSSSSGVDGSEAKEMDQEAEQETSEAGTAAADAELEHDGRHTPSARKKEMLAGATAAADEPQPRPVMQDVQLQAICLPFLKWLCEPPVTQCEALVKGKGRIKDSTALRPVKLNLRFVLALLMNGDSLDAEVPELQTLTRLPACKAIAAALESRQVGSGRMHAIFLLVKKVLVFLSSRESLQSLQRQYVPPSLYESFVFVDSICSDSSQRRRQETRNRAMLGIQTSKVLHQSQPVRCAIGLSADAFTMPSMLGNASVASVTKSASPPPPPASTTMMHLASAAATAADLGPSPNELTQDELKVVASGSLAYLKLRDPTYYVHHLVTAMLSLGLAPRSQVLKELRMGSSFVKEADGRYWVKMIAELNKNGKPTVFALPLQLTELIDVYLSSIRPQLLRRHGGPEVHDYVFFLKNGKAPRADFSEFTGLATMNLLGRAVNPHAFRSAVVTGMFESGASQGSMNMLANIMAHSSDTQRAFYLRPESAKAAVETNDRMLAVLDLSGSLEASPASVLAE